MRKKAIITGITGQDGSYLAELLLKKGYTVHGIKRKSSSFNTNRIDHIFEDPKYKSNFFLHYGDLTDTDSLTKIINKVKPHIIYLPFKGDIHSDHKHVFNAAYSCTKSFRYPFIKIIYMMETLSETEFSLSTKDESFIPNVFVDISDYMDKKIEAMEIYEGEMGSHPFPRSERNIKALATHRGATVGCEYAESFMLIKEVK